MAELYEINFLDNPFWGEIQEKEFIEAHPKLEVVNNKVIYHLKYENFYLKFKLKIKNVYNINKKEIYKPGFLQM